MNEVDAPVDLPVPPAGRRQLLIVILSILVFTGGGWGWWVYRSGPLVPVVSVQTGDAAEVVYATGTVEPVHWAKVTSLKRKRIVEICKCEGKAVKAGDVLVRLDDDEERAVLIELETRLERLRADVKRIKSLLERNVTSQTVFDEKLTQMREYEARIKAQRDRINDLQLKSPMDGIVLRRDGEVGEVAGVGDKDVLLWVGQLKPLHVVAEVNEDDIAQVRVDQTVLLRHEGLAGRVLNATVSRLTPIGDPDTKTFRVYLSLPDETPLLIGMSVEANIVVREVKGALLVPGEAVKDGQVQVIVDGRARRQRVEIGVRGTRMVEITSGLAKGALVLAPFQELVTDNGRIRKALDPDT